MRKLLWLVLYPGLAWATPTSYRQKIAVDLNGDGRKEYVVLKPYNVGEVTKGQLMVLDSGGKILWTGPRIKDAYSVSPWSFLGEFDMGDIAWLDDYDGDGQIDLCATYQKSDVRPTQFRLFHWNGKGFVYDRSAMLVPSDQRLASFEWKDYRTEAASWIDSMSCSSPGNYRGEVISPPDSAMPASLRYRAGEGFVRSR